MKCTKVLNLAAICAIRHTIYNWHKPDKVWSKLISLSMAVKSFTEYWLVRLLIDKKTLSSYSLIKVSKCLVAATCWYAVFLLNRPTKITPKYEKFVITFERSILSKIAQSKRWQMFRGTYCRLIRSLELSQKTVIFL